MMGCGHTRANACAELRSVPEGRVGDGGMRGLKSILNFVKLKIIMKGS